MGRMQKRWIDTVKESLKKIGLDVRQARRMVHDRSEYFQEHLVFGCLLSLLVWLFCLVGRFLLDFFGGLIG